MGLGDRVHGRGEDGNIEGNAPGEVGSRIGVGRENGTPGGDEENVVEGETFHELFREHREKKPVVANAAPCIHHHTTGAAAGRSVKIEGESAY
jgi:hypothetical protein